MARRARRGGNRAGNRRRGAARRRKERESQTVGVRDAQGTPYPRFRRCPLVDRRRTASPSPPHIPGHFSISVPFSSSSLFPSALLSLESTSIDGREDMAVESEQASRIWIERAPPGRHLLSPTSIMASVEPDNHMRYVRLGQSGLKVSQLILGASKDSVESLDRRLSASSRPTQIPPSLCSVTPSDESIVLLARRVAEWWPEGLDASLSKAGHGRTHALLAHLAASADFVVAHS